MSVQRDSIRLMLFHSFYILVDRNEVILDISTIDPPRRHLKIIKFEL